MSARRLVDGRELVQLSAAIGPGSSGGPVLDGQGRVFAVAVGSLEEAQQLNFAVPVRYALGLLAEAARAQPLAAVFEPPPSRVRLRFVRRQAELRTPLIVYVVPAREFEDEVWLPAGPCADLDGVLDSLEQYDPALERYLDSLEALGRVRLLGVSREQMANVYRNLTALRLVNLDLRLLALARALALDSAAVIADLSDPLVVPAGGALIGMFRMGVTYTVAPLPFDHVTAAGGRPCPGGARPRPPRGTAAVNGSGGGGKRTSARCRSP